jgi:SAM-dependent methyltransferase
MRSWLTRVVGAWRMVWMLLRSADLGASYAFLDHVRRYMFEPSVGMQRSIVQGLWDQYPGVAPTVRQLARLLEHDPPLSGEHLLDVGCGEGALVEQVLTRYPAVGRITALDVLPGHLARVEELVAGFPPALQAKVRLVLGDAQEADLALGVEALGPTVDKAYLVELSQDLTVAQFARTFDAVFRALRPGGLMALAVLATNRPPRGALESVIFDTVVRRVAPRQQDLQALFARYPCEVVEEDVTEHSSRRAGEYFLAHPDLVHRALLWPFDAIFNAAVRAGLGVIDTGGYSMRLVFLRKREPASSPARPRQASAPPA